MSAGESERLANGRRWYSNRSTMTIIRVLRDSHPPRFFWRFLPSHVPLLVAGLVVHQPPWPGGLMYLARGLSGIHNIWYRDERGRKQKVSTRSRLKSEGTTMGWTPADPLAATRWGQSHTQHRGGYTRTTCRPLSSGRRRPRPSSSPRTSHRHAADDLRPIRFPSPADAR